MFLVVYSNYNNTKGLKTDKSLGARKPANNTQNKGIPRNKLTERRTDQRRNTRERYEILEKPRRAGRLGEIITGLYCKEPIHQLSFSRSYASLHNYHP